ncbi:MAG TPA: HAD family hydrolase [Nitrososphaerales archaeon]|nr:HAD family hydrolase [Nitrososphaerales archaeon]
MTQRSGAQEAGYLRIPSPRGRSGLAVKTSSKELLEKVDAVAFDCDGVLIDARRSYDATIRVVVETMVEETSGVRLHLTTVIPKLISMVRRTGGFNSDWDTSYALTLFSLVALGERKGRVGRSVGATEELMRITASFGSAPRGSGKAAVDSFLEAEFPSSQEGLDKARKFLEYPRTPPGGRMTTVFDEVYFGAALFEKVHGVKSSAPREKGLIELERTLVDRRTLEALGKMLGGGRLAMITGRPYVGTEHSLGKLMRYFDSDASIFIGDADIDLSLRAEYDRMRKPSPEALVRAREKLPSETLLYVGDSAEDLMMVQNAKRKGLAGYLFAGVYQTSPVRNDQVSFFEREGSDVIVETVNQVPSGLLLPPKGEGAREE